LNRIVTDSSERVGLRAVFARTGYRRLLFARTASQWGDVFNTVALSLLVLQLTGSGVGVSGVVLAEIVPVLLFAPLAGTLVDRRPQGRIMIGADLARAILAGVLPLIDTHAGAVYAVAFGMSLGTVLFNPAANAVLPALVPDAELVAANSGIWTAAVLSQIVLAPVAGLLVLTAGVGPAFVINAASFLASAAILTGLHVPAADSISTARRGWLSYAGAGARLISGDRALRALAAGQLLAALSAGATSALLVVLARRHLHADASGYGLLLGAIGIGAASGPLLLTRLVRNPRRPAFVFGPYLLRSAVDFLLASVTALPAALLALVGYGLGTSTGAVTFNSLLQARAPAAGRGRVFAGFDLLWQLGRLLSLILGGITADALGIQAVYYLGGVLLLLAAVTGWRGLRPRVTDR
jgi:MFS family permease